MHFEDFVRSYSAKSNEELLRLRLDSKDLTDEGSAALMYELARRGIDGADKLDAFRDREKSPKEEVSRKPVNLFVSFRLGVGRWYFGKADRTVNPDGVEQFRTTMFILVFWIPLIPTGSYLVEKEGGFFSRKITILQKQPLDWEQVLKVWCVAAAAILAVILIVKRL